MSWKQRGAAGFVGLVASALVLATWLGDASPPVPRPERAAQPSGVQQAQAPSGASSAAASRSPALRELGSSPVVPPAATRSGSLPAAERLPIRLALRPRHAGELADLVAAISTPGSPRYRQPISRAQYQARYSPSRQTLRAVREQLEAAGLKVDAVNAARTLVAASGSSEAVGRLLHTSFSAYQLRGRRGFAADAAPKVGGALATAAVGVVGLSNLNPRVHHGLGARASARAAVSGPQPCGAVITMTGPNGPYAGGQLAKAYGLSAAYAAGNLGEGQSVAMYELAPYANGDITAFNQCYGISPTVTKVNVSGGPFGPVSAEPTLDIQMFASLAPKASIKVYQGPNDAVGPIDVFDRIAQDNSTEVTSVSWGACEAANGTANAEAEDVIFQQMAAQGQSVLAASGDSGSSDCYSQLADSSLSVDDPASQPYVTGVGGTTMTELGPPPTERVWNDQDPFSGGAGGGGISSTWPRPAWQWGPGTGSGSMRMVPDVSAAADPSYDMVMYMKSLGGWFQVGGTSAAAPLLAAATSLANQGCATRLGFLNPTLYALRSSGVAVTNDITQGSNDLLGLGSYNATAGYDPASGLGSPSASFLADLCSTSGNVTVSEQHSALSANYELSYTQGSAGLGTNDTITLAAPAGTAWPSSAAAWSVTVGASPPVAPSSVTVTSGSGSLSGNVATLTLAAAVPAGSAVKLAARGVTNPATAGSETITLTDSADNAPVLATYSLLASVPSAAQSSVAVSGSEAPADGVGAIGVDVTVKDGSGNLLVGQPVQVTMAKPSSAIVSPATGITDANGKASFSITDAVAQVTSGSVQSGGVTLGSTGSLTFRRTWSADYQLGPNAISGTPNVVTPPAASGVNVAALATTASRHLLVVTSTSGTYVRRDLTNLTGPANTSASIPAGSTVGTKLVVAARNAAGSLLVFSSSDLQAWTVANLSAATGLSVQGDAAVVDAGGVAVVYARGSNGHLLRFSNDASGNATWQAVDLTSLSGTPLVAASSPVAAVAGSREVVLLRSSKGRLVAFANVAAAGRLWTATDLNAASGTASTPTPKVKLTPAIAVGPGPSYTVYATAITTNGAMLVVASNGALSRPWVARDYSAAAGLAPVDSRISAVVQGNALRIFALGASGHVYEAISNLAVNPSISGVDLSAQFGLASFAAGPSAGLGLDGRVYVEGRSSTKQLLAYLRST